MYLYEIKRARTMSFSRNYFCLAIIDLGVNMTDLQRELVR